MKNGDWADDADSKYLSIKQDIISKRGDITDFLFQSNLGTPEHVWPQPTKTIRSGFSFYGFLSTCEKPR